MDEQGSGLMNLNLEKKVVAASLSNPEQFKRNELKTEWFHQPDYKTIIATLNKCDGNFVDFTDLVEKIKEDIPHTLIDENKLEMTSFEAHQVEDYENDVKLLKRSYFKSKVHSATIHYQNNPTSDNLQSMKDRIRELDDMEAPEDDGRLDPAVTHYMDMIENGTEPGILSYPQIDMITGGGFKPGALYTIGAATSVGKSAYALNLIVEMMTKQKNIAIDLFTLEMSKSEILARLLSRLNEINSYNLKEPKTKLDSKQQALTVKTALKISETNLRVHDKMYTLSDIKRQIIRRRYEEGDNLYIPIIDYIGLIDTEQYNMPIRLQISMITKSLKRLAQEIEVPILELSQLSRNIETRQDKTPVLSDLIESSSVEQDSSWVGLLYRDQDEDGITNLKVAKNRDGRLGVIRYRFLGQKMHFVELDD